MRSNLATFYKRLSILMAGFGLTGCASPALDPNAVTAENEKRFLQLLRVNQVRDASRFALYFSGEEATPTQRSLLAQYALLTCQPQGALAAAEKLPEGRTKDTFRAAALALMAVDRPWSKPLLEARALEAESGVREELKREVWQDEWDSIRVEVKPCLVFPTLVSSEEKETARAEALALFTRLAPFPSLALLGLAMDVGYAPTVADQKSYLQKFSPQSSHPYYRRLVYWENSRRGGETAFRPLQQRGAKVRLSSLDLHSVDFQPQQMEIPWLVF